MHINVSDCRYGTNHQSVVYNSQEAHPKAHLFEIGVIFLIRRGHGAKNRDRVNIDGGCNYTSTAFFFCRYCITKKMRFQIATIDVKLNLIFVRYILENRKVLMFILG